LPNKTNSYKIISILSVLVLFGCTTISPNEFNLNHLTRIDVEVVKSDGSYDESLMITDEENIDVLRKALKNIDWEPIQEPKLARTEDVKATLFFLYEENMPERLLEYQIWFHQDDDTATIISNHEEEGYGTIDKKNGKIIENILLNK
jgi:hypothetical protein